MVPGFPVISRPVKSFSLNPSFKSTLHTRAHTRHARNDAKPLKTRSGLDHRKALAVHRPVTVAPGARVSASLRSR